VLRGQRRCEASADSLVSGCLAMLPERPDSLNEALGLGISLFAGEAEGRFNDVL